MLNNMLLIRAQKKN